MLSLMVTALQRFTNCSLTGKVVKYHGLCCGAWRQSSWVHSLTALFQVCKLRQVVDLSVPVSPFLSGRW